MYKISHKYSPIVFYLKLYTVSYECTCTVHIKYVFYNYFVN